MTSQQPNILHLITRLDAGGSATDTIVIADLLRKHGFRTSIAVGRTHDPDGSIAKELAGRGITRYDLPHLVRGPSPIKDLIALREVKRLLCSETFDLVHTHSSKAGVIGRSVAHELNIPAVHTPHGHIFYGYFNPLITAFYVLIERWAARRSLYITSLTDRETRESLERGIGQPHQYVTIHSGVHLASFTGIDGARGAEFRNQFDISSDAMLVISVARLVPIKGFDVLLNALAKVRDSGSHVTLALVGEGTQRDELEAMARELDIVDLIRFTGQLDDVRPALAAADAFVLPSRNEGMGRALIEAMAAGLPCIASGVGGIPDIITHGEDGLLVPPEDPVSLSKAIVELASDERLRKKLGVNAAASVYPEYDEKRMITQLADLYRNSLGQQLNTAGNQTP